MRANGVWRGATLAVIAVAVLVLTYWPAQAAVELLYFRAESTATSVVLSWATAREIDVDAYLIYCKPIDEPDTEYRWIGQKWATGGPDLAAEYTFEATEDLYYGEQYCFRLEEITTNEEPGERRDICGYGPGVTPTPVVATGVPAAGASVTPIVVTPVPDQSPAPTLFTPIPTLLPGTTPTSTPVGQSPIETPTVDPFATDFSATATATSPISPLGTPSPTWTSGPEGSGAGASDTASATPTLTPAFTPTESPTPTPTATQPTSPEATPTALAAGVDGTGEGMLPDTETADTPTYTASPTATMGVAGGSAGAGEGVPSGEATATPLYVVVTATPTLEAVAAAPTLTPLPTVTSTPDMGLLNVLTPSAQNMMVMMLCLIFLSATGLGTLGLVTTILYFRSQAQHRTDGRSFTDRRRF